MGIKAEQIAWARVRKGGFTLIELLAVMVIVGLLLAFSGAAMLSAMGSHRLSTAVGAFRNDVGWAAIESSKDNRPVHVRLYRFQPEETVAEDSQYYAYQFLVVDSRAGRMVPLTEVRRFGDGVVAHPDAEYSSVFTLTERVPDTSERPGEIADPELLLPAYSYVEFLVRPDGSTDLPKDRRWSLTLVESKRLEVSASELPSDYRALVINPFTAATRIY